MNYETEKIKDFNENRKTIVPITFVNGNIKATDELNNMFTLPYDLAVLERASVLDALKNIETNFDPGSFKSFCRDVARVNKNNFEDAIKSFLLMNCREFIYLFMSNTMTKLCVDTLDNNRRYDNREINIYIDERKIDKIVLDHLNSFVFCMSENIDAVRVYYHQLMNSLYFQIVTFVDDTIRYTVYNKYSGNYNAADVAFDNLVAKVYGENNGIKSETLTHEFKYAFATSILREMMEQELPTLYHGLHQIFMSAASMACVKSLPDSREEIVRKINQNNIPGELAEVSGANIHNLEMISNNQ